MATTVLSGIETEPGSGVEVEVSSVFFPFPQRGTVPMQVRIANHTGSDGVWHLRFSDRWRSELVTHFDFEVPAGQTGAFSIAPTTAGRTALPPRIKVSGPGVIAGQAAMLPAVVQEGSVPLVALSHSLAGPSLKRFTSRSRPRSKGRSFGVTGFEPAELLTQWRSLAGVAWLLMSEAEWAGLDPERRDAIRRWVAWGGELVLASPSPAACRWSPAFSEEGEGPHAYGSGHFRAILWMATHMAVEPVESLVASRTVKNLDTIPAEWPSLKRLGTPRAPNLFIALFVVAFAVMVGPVNLFWLAPAGRRHRLFVTTPLLSLGGTFVLLVAMYAIDGTGGAGSRFVALELLPGGKEMAVTQDQIARTGLLFSSRFALQEEALVQPLKLPAHPFPGGKIAGRTYSGHWFRSRSIQAQQLAVIRSAQAAVTQVGKSPAGAPVLVSSLANPLETVLFRDAGGALWKGSALRPGERATLQPVPEERWKESARWWKTAHADALPGPHTVRFREQPLPAAGHFYATLATAAGQAVETLDAIVWEDRGIVVGPVEGALSTTLQEGGSR